MNTFQLRRTLKGMVLLVLLVLTACEGGSLPGPQAEQAAQPPPTQQPTPTVGVTSPLPTPTTIAEQATPTLLPPIPTISAPTLTPLPTTLPLSPLDENLQTLVYALNGPQGPEIYRVQVDKKGQKVGPVENVGFPTGSRRRILDLFPSPDGKRVAIDWVQGDGGAAFVHVLDVATGQLTPLLGEETGVHSAVTFLDWAPDGQNILVIGVPGNPDLGNSAWLVDVETHAYRDINIKQVNRQPTINGASFSPDGAMLVYAQRDCGQCGSQIWRLNLNNSDRLLLFEDSQARIENVMWSPDGKHIAFTQWTVEVGTFPWAEFGTGELRVMNADGSQERLLSSMVIHFDNSPFRPTWAPESQQIAFVKSENVETEKRLDELFSNIYVADVSTNQIRQLTRLENVQIVKPSWSPDGSKIAFLSNENRAASLFGLQSITVDGRELRAIELDNLTPSQNNSGVQSNNLDTQSSIIWLP